MNKHRNPRTSPRPRFDPKVRARPAKSRQLADRNTKTIPGYAGNCIPSNLCWLGTGPNELGDVERAEVAESGRDNGRAELRALMEQ